MGVVLGAVIASVVAGASTGVLLAITISANGYRARRSLRRHQGFARKSGVSLAIAGAVVSASGIYAATYQRLGLAVTCVAAALLVALASWLLLVEDDDDYPEETPDEPSWWPDFEQQFHDWSRRNRVPAGRA